MINVKVSNREEIRMGSPFQICQLTIAGVALPELPLDGWTPIFATSFDGTAVALTRWDILENKPGFRLILVKQGQTKIQESARISGCCESLVWAKDKIQWKAFPQSEGELASDFD
ncbi:MAG TPA: hypothetical protein VMB47_00550 [Candidatus Aquilonibacter sp.]|nr:hypothetical protein [Candidatus Aquilonibacter sp.]